MKSQCNLHHSKHEFCCIQVHSLYENPVEILQGMLCKKHPVQCNIVKHLRRTKESVTKQAFCYLAILWEWLGNLWERLGNMWKQLGNLWERLSNLWERLAILWQQLSNLWNDFLTCGNDLLTCGNDFLTCGNELLTRGHNFLSCGNEIKKLLRKQFCVPSYQVRTISGQWILQKRQVVHQSVTVTGITSCLQWRLILNLGGGMHSPSDLIVLPNKKNILIMWTNCYFWLKFRRKIALAICFDVSKCILYHFQLYKLHAWRINILT